MPLVYVLLNTEPGHMEKVLEEVREIDGVVEAYMLYGIYDICAKVRAEEAKDLKGIVQKIRSEDNVTSTLSLMVVH